MYKKVYTKGGNMYFKFDLGFCPQWLFNDWVSGPLMYKEQIEEDAWNAWWDAIDREVDSHLYNEIMDAGDDLDWQHTVAQLDMEDEILARWNLGDI